MDDNRKVRAVVVDVRTPGLLYMGTSPCCGKFDYSVAHRVTGSEQGQFGSRLGRHIPKVRFMLSCLSADGGNSSIERESATQTTTSHQTFFQNLATGRSILD